MSITPVIVGVAGGSGSGKTYFANRLLEQFGHDKMEVLLQDHYYRDQSAKFDEDGGSVNFDHPDALDFDLLAEHLKLLKSGRSVEVPRYDFATHTRLPDAERFEPRPLIVLDGILILSQPKIVELLDYSIYVDTPEPLRFQRRLSRDIKERGREEAGVIKQYQKQVLPMHNEFVEPSKAQAAAILKDGSGDEDVCVDKILVLLKSLSGER